LKPSYRGRDRNDADRQDIPADEAVQKRTFPRFELTDNDDIDEGLFTLQGLAR